MTEPEPLAGPPSRGADRLQPQASGSNIQVGFKTVPTLGVQGELCRCSENRGTSGGLPVEARGEVTRAEERERQSRWGENWWGVRKLDGSMWVPHGRDKTQGACAQACDGVPKILDLLVSGGGGFSLPQGL